MRTDTITPVVYVDFDGTITLKDIGDELFKHFSVFEPYHKNLLTGELAINEYWKILCRNIRNDVGFKEIEEYAENCLIDLYFLKFVDFCSLNGIKVNILSDGFDAYIQPLLKKYDLDWITVYSNNLLKREEGFIPYFPNASESCGCLCASCKRNVLLTSVATDDTVVFIGDGISDYCVAEHSDIVFAKKKLASYCNEKRIPHYPYKTFFDVIRIFEKLFATNSFKKRRQAELSRQRAFQVE
jgi:2,3-diketo-5-methylthio-1-phosphopentane phosphatase